MDVAYIELSNEPNGHWTTYIDPVTWAKLACAVRAELDVFGLHGTAISGPGVSMGESIPYLEALTKVDGGRGMQCIGLLSLHTWESTSTRAGPSEMAGLLTKWDAVRAKYDPNHTLPLAATEYGSRTGFIAGRTFNVTVNACYPDLYKEDIPAGAQSLSPLYGARVAAFTLLHMNHGFDGALYWWVSDYGWSPLCFGLETRGLNITAPARALSRLFASEPFHLATSSPVTPTWTDDDTVQAASVVGTGTVVLWVAHNPGNGSGSLERSYRIRDGGVASLGATPVALGRIECYPLTAGCNATLADGLVSVSLEPEFVMALEVAMG